MIKKTLENTKKSTFFISTPSHIPSEDGFPRPSGTGFFISNDGYCLTARHVLYKRDDKGKNIVDAHNIPKLIEETSVLLENENMMYIQGVKIVKDWPEYDIVLMKVKIDDVKQTEYFKNKENFDHLKIDFKKKSEGEKIYSFGYPLSTAQLQSRPNILIGTTTISPRVTSAIIASHHKEIGPLRSSNDPKYYVIDKALNYGNSGGPIVVEDLGTVISVCTQFQPVMIPQQSGYIMTPSLYGITSSLENIESELKPILGKDNKYSSSV